MAWSDVPNDAETSNEHFAKKTSHKETSINVVGLILARGTSKGLPRKNVRVLNGLPLIAWVIRPMKDANVFSSIWVSTDDDEIAAVATQLGVSVHRRTLKASSDKASSLESVQEFLLSHEGVDVIGLVQCTSPCLHPDSLQRAVYLIGTGGYDSLFSVTRQYKLRWKEEPNGEVSSALNFDPSNRPRRQDWCGEIVESGHFYFAKVSLIKNGYLQGRRCAFVELNPEVCIEIDREEDWPFAELAVKLHGYYGNPP